MTKPLNRRDFLKLSALSLGGLAFRPLRAALPPEDRSNTVGIGRVTIDEIGVYKKPDLESEKLWTRTRNELVSIFEEVVLPDKPKHYRRWYRVVGGFCHCAYLQRVETAHLNTVLNRIPSGGKLAEVTVPYTQSMQLTEEGGWVPAYLLYFESVHWITGIDEGPDGQRWYRLTDELLHQDYHVRASHLRPITAEELTPLSPDVPEGQKSIEVDLLRQTFTAFEFGNPVLQTEISSGLPGYGPRVDPKETQTPKGNFTIDIKMPSKHMGDGELTSDITAYELPGVSWVCFFNHPSGLAFHGTYWHDNFGSRMSHGCVNLRGEDAKWVYRWSTPVARVSDWESKGHGTKVAIY